MTLPVFALSWDGAPMWLPTEDFTSIDWLDAAVWVDCNQRRGGRVFIPNGSIGANSADAAARLNWLDENTDWFVSGFQSTSIGRCTLRLSFKDARQAMLYKLTWGGVTTP